ncbi:MAG: hypothetical protein N2450_05565 [bacterium]|nr:hypothetical protein [bacterium]
MDSFVVKYGVKVQLQIPEVLQNSKTDLLPNLPMERSKNAILKLLEPPLEKDLRKKWFIRRIIILFILIWAAILAILLGVDKPVVAAILVVFGIVSQAFAAILALIALIPVIGPTLVWALSLPIVWLLNAFGYVVSIKLASQGKGREILNWRTVALVFIIGTAVGIVIGRFLP